MDDSKRSDEEAGSETDRPVDGPGRGEPGDEADLSTSQDQPGAAGDAAGSGPEDEPERDEPAGERRATNEVADEKVRVVEPGTDEASPRA